MVTRPVPGNTAATLASINSLCDAADAAAGQIADLQQIVEMAQAAVSAEVQARGTAIAGEVQARGIAITAEAQARAGAIQQEQQDRQSAIAAAVQALNTSIRALGDSLRQALNAETTARTSADSAEQEARADAVNAQARALASAVADLEDQLADKASRTDLTAAGAAQSKALADAIAGVRSITDAISASAALQRFEFVAAPGRPGDAPARYTFVAAASALAGPISALPLIPGSMLATADNGLIVRVDGSGIVAGRVAQPIEPGRLYRARYVVQRRTNPSDPSGDAVVCGLVYLDQSRRVLGDVVPVRSYPSLITANGRQESEALISRSAGLGAAFQAPMSARFMVPVVAFYGPDALTDVEVLSIEDVTGAFVLAPPIANFEARLAALEAADIASRLQTLESEAGTPGKLTFGSKGDATYATIPDSVQVIELLGRKFAGDGGGGRYVRTSAQLAADADSIASHGAVFVRETVSPDVVAGMLESGFEAWMAGLPTEPPPNPGKRWNDNGQPAITPAVAP